MTINKIKKELKLRTEFDFDSAHLLDGYDGNCKNIHGHRWRVILTIKGNCSECDSVGILWDFKKRKILKDLFDHKLIVQCSESNKEMIDMLNGRFNMVGITDGNPTAEYLSMYILCWLLEDNNKLKYKVRLYESTNSYCEVKSNGY